MNPFTIIEGKYPTYNELKDFTEDRWLNLLRFLDFFIVSYENSEKWITNSNKIEEMEAYLTVDNHPFHEMIYRTGQWKGKTTPKKYQYKINGLLMHSLGWLKKHPGAVTPNMKVLIEAHPKKMAWCLGQFKVKETLSGGEIVVRDNTVVDNLSTRQTNLPSLQVKVMTSIIKVADIVETIADSISSTELKKMDTDEKLKHIARLVPIITGISKKQNVGNHLTQININGNTDDIEKQMLSYVQKTNE